MIGSILKKLNSSIYKNYFLITNEKIEKTKTS